MEDFSFTASLFLYSHHVHVVSYSIAKHCIILFQTIPFDNWLFQIIIVIKKSLQLLVVNPIYSLTHYWRPPIMLVCDLFLASCTSGCLSFAFISVLSGQHFSKRKFGCTYHIKLLLNLGTEWNLGLYKHNFVKSIQHRLCVNKLESDVCELLIKMYVNSLLQTDKNFEIWLKHFLLILKEPLFF